MSYDPLDENQLSLLIETLLRAKTFGFSISASPVEPLIEVMVDLSLQLRNLLKEGKSPWQQKLNPELKFLEQADELGNFKSLKLLKPTQPAFEPEVSEWFSRLAQDLIAVKTHHHLPKNLYSFGKGDNGPHRKQRPQVYHYFRRIRQKHQASPSKDE